MLTLQLVAGMFTAAATKANAKCVLHSDKQLANPSSRRAPVGPNTSSDVRPTTIGGRFNRRKCGCYCFANVTAVWLAELVSDNK